MNISFVLKDPQATESIISLIIRNKFIKRDADGNPETKTKIVDGKTIIVNKDTRIKKSTKLKVQRSKWNKNKQYFTDSFVPEIRAKETINYKIDREQKETTKRNFDKLLAFLHGLHESVKSDKEALTKIIDDFINNDYSEPQENKYKDDVTFFEFSKQLLIDKQQKEFVSTLRRTNEILQEFEEEINYKIDFDTINLTFYDRFLAFMNNRGYSINYKGKQISNVKYFMNEAYERHLHENRDFKSRKFKSMEELVEKIYLTDAEIKKIHDLDLSHKPYLDNAKDLFLIGCYTGLRFSDFSQVRPDNINADFTILTIRTQKTDKKVYIPLRPEVAEIIKKHNGTPRSISNVKLNVYIKEVGKLTEINGDVVVYKSQGTQTIKEVKQKYELICTHTARRSFATNCYKAGIPIKSIMLITGHSTEIDFFKYIRITEAENAEILLNHSYFNK